jgi:RNA polymerase sigma-54 factor
VPDAVVEYDADQDRYVAYLNDRRMSNVRINQEYAKLAKDKSMERKDRDFIKTNLGNAQWLLEAVGQRRQTLLRVIEAVIAKQRDFFDYGPQALRPLPMQAVAEELGIHVATVSRAVAEKYLATPRGVLPLRKFFSGGVQTKAAAETGEGGGEDMAWEAVKAALQELVDAEDKKSPLSDEALAEALKAKGIEIARRTVAKYREQLGIPAKRLRKTF